jgi:hypothetical protein
MIGVEREVLPRVEGIGIWVSLLGGLYNCCAILNLGVNLILKALSSGYSG